MSQEQGEPAVIRNGFISCQICVPKDWTDAQALEFVEKENPSGTENGWFIRTDEKLLNGDPYRNDCCELEGHVHITFDC